MFVLFWRDPPNRDASDHVLGVFDEEGAWALFHDVWTCGAKVFEYWKIFSLKIIINCSYEFQRNWNVPMVLLERFWWALFNVIYLVRFGFRMWEILILKLFQPLKIQINSKKKVLEGKTSWGCGNNWANGTNHPSTMWKIHSTLKFSSFQLPTPLQLITTNFKLLKKNINIRIIHALPHSRSHDMKHILFFTNNMEI